jgi:hypothetical protein
VAHVLILGTTESGKTTCGKRLAHRWYDYGTNVIILDPLNDPGWKPDGYTESDDEGPKIFQTSDPDEFLEVFWASRRCAAFVDEAGDAVGRYDVVMQKTATRGRHWGHSVHFLTQRGVQISVTVRDQCTRLFLFRTGPRDAKTHAEEWAQPELLNSVHLRKGNYYYVTRFGELQRGSLFGEKFDGPDTDIRNGGRDVRGEEGTPAAPQTTRDGGRPATPAAPKGGRPAAVGPAAPESGRPAAPAAELGPAA